MSTLGQRIKEQARELGFSLVGIVPAQPSPYLAAYLEWIKAGMHGTMGYMARADRIQRREDLNVILPGVRSLIVAALDYYTLRLPDAIAHDPARGRISNYAWGADYHHVMLAQLETLAQFVRTIAGAQVTTRVYVDTGAILERSHAAQAGLGFVGKNTLLIHPRRGSFFFLGEILTTAALDDDTSASPMPSCGTCTRCLTACPTGAFPRPYVLDARLCISYLTIEHKGSIPRHLRPQMGNWVYGCDVCQEVCPWQRFARPTAWWEAFAPLDFDRAAPPLTRLLALDEVSFAAQFRGSAIERIGRTRLVRNACIAAGNSGLPDIAPYLVPLLNDPSPLVRGHAAWALGRLGAGKDALRSALAGESDEAVREELMVALTGEENP